MSTDTVRKGPNPNLSHAAYFRAMDKIVQAPMTDYEAQRFAELKQAARTTGVGGDDRRDYVMLCQIDACHR